MATKDPVVSQPTHDTLRVVWANVTQSDDCAAVTPANSPQLSQYDDRSVQISGSLGAATVAIQGSLNGSDYADLRDPMGVALSGLDALLLRGILEYAESIKPVRDGGDGSTDFTVTLLAKRKRR